MTLDQSTSAVGTRVGRYEIVTSLARGGMADVYLARDTGTGDEVALKVVSGKRALDAEACALFLDEARVVSLLDHPNIAAIHDLGVADGARFLAMEYVRGADLREVLAAASRRGALPSYAASLAIVLQAAAGLDHAHRRCDEHGTPLQLVHRDVSLSNVMVRHDGVVKVVDFGIARSTLQTIHTAPGVVRGKASYMSPEQCVGDPVDLRTDVFALGIVLYELTTGARCFAGKTDFERMLAVVRGEYTAPSDLVAGYPPELEAVVKTALATNPAQRYASCAALIVALEAVMAVYGWIGSIEAIQRAMADLFAATDAQTAALAEEAAAKTVENVVVFPMPPTLKLTRPRRLARGTIADADPTAWTADDDDARTGGHRRLRRPSVPHLAA